MITRTEIVAALNAFEAVVQEWLQLDENAPDDRAHNLMRPYKGRVVRAIQPWLADAAEKLFAVCDTDEIERDAWPLVRALDKFDDALTACAAKLRQSGADQDPNGGNTVWRPWDDVRLERDKPRLFRDPEPIPQLRSMRNPPTPEQICKMYCWYDQQGLPDVVRLQREIDQPGSEFDPATWVNPWKNAYWQELEGWWDKRCAAFTQSGSAHGKTPVAPKVEETLDELVLQGVNAQQIKKMLPGTTDEEISDLCAEYGVALDGGIHSTFMDAVHTREKQALAAQVLPKPVLSSKLSTIETYADLGDDVEARVVRMYEDGHKASVIAAALKNQLVRPLAPSHVGKILAAHKRAAQAIVPV